MICPTCGGTRDEPSQSVLWHPGNAPIPCWRTFHGAKATPMPGSYLSPEPLAPNTQPPVLKVPASDQRELDEKGGLSPAPSQAAPGTAGGDEIRAANRQPAQNLMEQAAELEKVRGPVLALLDALERGQLIMLNAGGLVLELGRSHPLTPLLAPAAMVLDADDVAALAALKEAGDA